MNQSIERSMQQSIVLMASHLGSKDRHQTIKWALESLRKQTKLPDEIHIAFSYNERPNVEEWKCIVDPIPLILYESPIEKLSQFTHYYKIFDEMQKYYLPNTIIMFLDDDDLYDPRKVEMVTNAFETNEEVVKHSFQVFGNPYMDNMLTADYTTNLCDRVVCRNEYWSFAFRVRHLEHINDCLEEYKIKEPNNKTMFEPNNNYFDLIFGNFIPSHLQVNIPTPLMYIRRDGIKRDYLN